MGIGNVMALAISMMTEEDFWDKFNRKHNPQFYEKLKKKGIILRSTEDGYHIKNKLRLTIGSKKENLKFMIAIKQVLKK